jgi:hypothetical protein
MTRRCPHGIAIGIVRCEVDGCVAAGARVMPNGYAWCSRCKAAKPASTFGRRGGDGQTRSRCLSCEAKADSERHARRAGL